jgi:hypothetical protein
MSQLEFSYTPGVQIAWQPQRKTEHTKEYFDLPDQLKFQLAEPPLIMEEKPKPLMFEAQPKEERKKLVQFAGIPKRKTSINTRTVKYSNLSNLPIGKLKKQPAKRKTSRPKTAPALPEWNSDTQTPGLFDVKISKKVPIQIQHTIKKVEKSTSKPQILHRWEDIETKPEVKQPKRPETARGNQSVTNAPISPRFPRSVSLANNLDFKFVEDQEKVVQMLEKQLKEERDSRQKLDQNFQQKMHQLERYKSLDKEILVAREEFKKAKQELDKARATTVSKQEVDKPRTIKPKAPVPRVKPSYSKVTPAVMKRPASQPRNHSRTRSITHEEPIIESISIEDSTSEDRNIIIDRESGGNVFEIPTRDKPSHIQFENRPAVLAKPNSLPSQVRGPDSIPQPILQQTVREVAHDIQDSNINRALFQASCNVTDLSDRMQPLLETITNAVHRLDASSKYGASNVVGLVSKVSARYIAYYSDTLTDMLLSDLLEDTVHELQYIEQREVDQNTKLMQRETDDALNNLLKTFEKEAESLQEKYMLNKPKKKVWQIEEDAGPEIILDEKPRFWELTLEDAQLRNIREYRNSFKEFQKQFTGTGAAKLWEVYAKLADEFLSGAIIEVLKEYELAMHEFTEEVISSEFI